MISLHKPPLWRQILRKNFVHWKKLAAFLELTEQQQSVILPNHQFSLNLPFRLAEKIEKQNLEDPILKQFLPTLNESVITPEFIQDPVGDNACQRTSKLLHKYEGRALLVCTSACAMHCRYCFRQNFDYSVQRTQFVEELAIISSDTSLREIILSGGDPLSLSDEFLQNLFQNLGKIPHVRRLRIHTRYPIGIPERIDENFLKILKAASQQVWFVIHANHPRELDEDVLESLAQVRRLGIVVMNQAVLLQGVNDDRKTLKELCERLINHGILPYYLHQLDRVQGAAHFDVPEEKGLRLIEDIRKELPGYAIPCYVKEIAGQSSKTPL